MTGRRHHARATTVAAVLSIAVAACGSHGPAVSPAAARTLHGEVQIVRAAAAIRDRAAAAAAVAHLDQTLASLRADGRVTDAARVRIERAVARVRADLARIPPTTTTSATTTTTRARSGRGKGHEKRHGSDKEHDD